MTSVDERALNRVYMDYRVIPVEQLSDVDKLVEAGLVERRVVESEEHGYIAQARLSSEGRRYMATIAHEWE